MAAKSPSPKGESKQDRSKKGESKSSRGAKAPASDKAKTVKAVLAVVALVATATWLVIYYDPFELRKPEPGPAPDAFIEQLPEPERQRTRDQIERTREQIESGEEAPQTSGQ